MPLTNNTLRTQKSGLQSYKLVWGTEREKYD